MIVVWWNYDWTNQHLFSTYVFLNNILFCWRVIWISITAAIPLIQIKHVFMKCPRNIRRNWMFGWISTWQNIWYYKDVVPIRPYLNPKCTKIWMEKNISLVAMFPKSNNITFYELYEELNLYNQYHCKVYNSCQLTNGPSRRPALKMSNDDGDQWINSQTYTFTSSMSTVVLNNIWRVLGAVKWIERSIYNNQPFEITNFLIPVIYNEYELEYPWKIQNIK